MTQKLPPMRNQKKESSGPKTESSDKYSLWYHKKYYRAVTLKFNTEKDREILAWLDSRDTIKPYLVSLIKQDMEKHPLEVQAVIDKLNEEFPPQEFDIYNLKDDERYIKCDNCGFDTVILVEKEQVINYRRCPKCKGVMHESLPIVELTEENDGLNH